MECCEGRERKGFGGGIQLKVVDVAEKDALNMVEHLVLILVKRKGGENRRAGNRRIIFDNLIRKDRENNLVNERERRIKGTCVEAYHQSRHN